MTPRGIVAPNFIAGAVLFDMMDSTALLLYPSSACGRWSRSITRLWKQCRDPTHGFRRRRHSQSLQRLQISFLRPAVSAAGSA
ncbi:hypothetical protein A0H81_01793 [Grifola frondosa]|uniref:Uncharacterized protein n=1 Tax=Grifola frondosa TaxID=5627 RepID=A0A1C7MNB7_GRIFR|nr:hypothetical protein A0H81_01793 [Grifola frondosa]